MSTAKRPYQSPKLVEWGTVVDLTRMVVDPCLDAAYSGSVPCEFPTTAPA